MLNPRIVALGAFALVTPLAFAQVDPQARRALENMAGTVQEAKTISYRVQMHGEGSMFGLLPRSSATVTMKRREGADGATTARGSTWLIRVEGRSEGLDQPFDFIVVSDGQRYSWLDHDNQRLIYRQHSAARGQPTDTAVQLQLPTFAEATPLERDLASPTIELVEQTSLDGQACDVVLVDPGELQPKMRWTIARDDGLPRRAERLIQGGPLNDRQIWTVSELKVNGEVDDSMFTITAPEGYTTIGAPIAVRPASGDGDSEDAMRVDRPQRTDTAPAARVVGTSVDNLAPDFELEQPGVGKVRLSDLRGQVVLLDFWGTWCLPCRRSSPEVQKVHDDYKDKGVRVFGLAVRERNDENPINYMKEHEYTYGLLLRADDVASEYRVRVYPTFLVIGREGEIVHIESSFDPQTSFTQIRSAIDRALAGQRVAKPMVEHRDGQTTTVTSEEGDEHSVGSDSDR